MNDLLLTAFWAAVAGFGGGVLGAMLYLAIARRWREHQNYMIMNYEVGPRDPDEEPTLPFVVDVPERSRYGKCLGCGVGDDEWCRPKCDHYDRWDTRVES